MSKPATKLTKEQELEQAHENGECVGLELMCPICIEEWEEWNREELGRQGYYIGDKWVR